MLRQFFSSSSSSPSSSKAAQNSAPSSATSNSPMSNYSSSNQLPSKMEVSVKSEANVPGLSRKDSGVGGSDPKRNHPRNNPGDASEIDPTNNDSLVSLFECPVCFEYVLPPILQCQNGHLICKSCRTMITSCPTCRAVFGPTNIRNLSLEKLSSTVKFPCKFSSNGCQEVLYYKDKAEHEESKCLFKPYCCPCPGSSCKWAGSMDQVMSHLMTSHKSITTLEGEDIVFLATDINLSGAVDWVMIQSCFNHHFMLVLEKAEKYAHHQQFFAAVVLIGGEKQAENFIYRLELNAQKRRLVWEAQPRSINEGVQSAINSSDCLIFDASIAHHFADGGNLGINVTIQLANKDGGSKDGSLSSFASNSLFNGGGGTTTSMTNMAAGNGNGSSHPHQQQVQTDSHYGVITRSHAGGGAGGGGAM